MKSKKQPSAPLDVTQDMSIAQNAYTDIWKSKKSFRKLWIHRNVNKIIIRIKGENAILSTYLKNTFCNDAMKIYRK